MIKSELRKVEELYEVVVSSSEHDRKYMGNAATTPQVAKDHALNVASNLLADAQARLLKAQSDAIAARQVVESIKKLDVSSVVSVPRGWSSVQV